MKRIVTLRVKIVKDILTIICVYASEEGRKEETQFFCEALQREINKYKISHHLIIAGDLNARVGNQSLMWRVFSERV